jgi:hypothetical protein
MPQQQQTARQQAALLLLVLPVTLRENSRRSAAPAVRQTRIQRPMGFSCCSKASGAHWS